MFEYMTAQEAAELWGISVRRVQRLCKENRIEGVLNINRMWLIPKSSKKPVDKRRKVTDYGGLIDGLQYSLKKNGFDVDFVRSVQETLTYLSEIEKYDMLILDVTLPDGTGFEICEKVRKNGSQIPIIFLTASDEEVSIIRGLDCGGDDYITKPFKLGELCSRIRALLRRAGLSTQGTGAVMECGDIKIDLLGSRVLLKGKILELTAAEYRLICLLVKNANRIITRDIILDELWDSTGDYVDNNTLSVYVRRLREKIETDPSHPEHLLTVRGFGYQWKEVDE